MVQLDIDGGIQGFGHRPVLGPRIVRNVPRLPESLVERFRTAYVPDISDAVGQLYTLNSDIRPFYRPMKRLVGLALTVKAPPGDNLTIHGALNMAQAGDVLVVDWRGYTEGCGTGAGSMMPPISRGLAGVVVDGGWRDIAELQAIDFPIFGKSVAAFSPPKSRPGEINVPVCCGGVIVHAGDVVVADEEGIVVVPRDFAQIVADSLREYSARTSMEEWDLERLKQGAVQRGQYYEALFNARNGTYAEWPGGPKSGGS
jgi:4-hydroxy-4-methyl-2-oxoglutarate aldolase